MFVCQFLAGCPGDADVKHSLLLTTALMVQTEADLKLILRLIFRFKIEISPPRCYSISFVPVLY